jgi:hypothetical protein
MADVAAKLERATPTQRQRLYAQLGLRLDFTPGASTLRAQLGAEQSVGGGTRTLTPRTRHHEHRIRCGTDCHTAAFGRGLAANVSLTADRPAVDGVGSSDADNRRSGAFRLCDEGAGGRLGEDRAASCRPRSFALVMRRLSHELHVYRAQRAEGRSVRGGIAGAWRSGVARTGSIARHDHRLCSFPGWRP